MHETGCFVPLNPWESGTALYLQHLGYETLATTSAGFAFTRGNPDGGVSRDEMLSHIREVVAATALPVNADFLNGFADEPEALSRNVRLRISTNVAGLSIEDSTGRRERRQLICTESSPRRRQTQLLDNRPNEENDDAPTDVYTR